MLLLLHLYARGVGWYGPFIGRPLVQCALRDARVCAVIALAVREASVVSGGCVISAVI